MAITPNTSIDNESLAAKVIELQTAVANLDASETGVLNSVVPGTAAASKAVVLDANKAVDVVRTASLRIGASGSEVDKTNVAIGVAAGYKVARGVHQQAAASDTVITGLTTVVAVVVSWRDAPTVKQLFCNATIGDQAGTPAAGSILIRTYKPTAVNDVTPTAATDFTENLSVNWVAIGT